MKQINGADTSLNEWKANQISGKKYLFLALFYCGCNLACLLMKQRLANHSTKLHKSTIHFLIKEFWKALILYFAMEGFHNTTIYILCRSVVSNLS